MISNNDIPIVSSILKLGISFKTVRVKDGMSLRNGIIMRNTIYAENKLTEERVMFSCQFYKSSSFFDTADSSRILIT